MFHIACNFLNVRELADAVELMVLITLFITDFLKVANNASHRLKYNVEIKLH